MKKIKQVFPSRNYITVDSYGDVEVIFNPVGDGFEGDDKLMFRKGRWAFRVNDFLSGKVMADGSKEGMGRKVYSLNLVYDDEDGEPIVNTTYVDPTSVIPLDGSVVDIVGSEKLAQEKTLQTVEKNTSGLFNIIPVFELIGNEVQNNMPTRDSQTSINMSVDTVSSKIDNLASEPTLNSLKVIVDGISDLVDTRATIAKQNEIISNQDKLENLCRNSFFSSDNEYLADIVSGFWDTFGRRFRRRNSSIESIGGKSRYSAGTVFYFGTNRFISLRSDCITVSVGSEFLLLGDMSEYNNGTVKRLDGVKFAQSDVTKIES